ncbi:MAG: MFS transporter [Clostridia bacterium]|nr:MFS transporter [Clostridia bacterium]
MVHLLLAVIYLAFVSLGLPDGLLGAAWPAMYGSLHVPVSYAGYISMIICFGTIASSLMSDRLTRALGAGLVTACSVALTAASLFGFALSPSFAALCLWAVPYGLGAGSVDAALNNYVAIHYKSRHMSWLHCMWGLGCVLGPYIMGNALASGRGWEAGYRTVGVLQIGLTVLLFISLPMWGRRSAAAAADGGRALRLAEVLRVPGAKMAMLTFFCYCSLEGSAMLWASSYLALVKAIPTETAAAYGSLFYIGITVGRAASGFLTMKLSDVQMVRLGQAIIAAGIVVLLLPLGNAAALTGLVLVGLGCAPVFPCMLHATPANFGESRSQALMGVQMASAYVGTALMPPLFGWIAGNAHIGWLPLYLALILAGMIAGHEILMRRLTAGRLQG